MNNAAEIASNLLNQIVTTGITDRSGKNLETQKGRKLLKLTEEVGELCRAYLKKFQHSEILSEFADCFIVLHDLVNIFGIKTEELNEEISKKLNKWEQTLTKSPNFVLTQINKAIYEAKLEGKVETKFIFQINFDKENIQNSIDALVKEGYELIIKMVGSEHKEIMISWEI